MKKIPDFPSFVKFTEEIHEDSSGSPVTVFSLKVDWWKAVPLQFVSCDEKEKEAGREMAIEKLTEAFESDFWPLSR
jgi:hypothetical protein